MRQSRPDSDVVFQTKVLNFLELFPPGSGCGSGPAGLVGLLDGPQDGVLHQWKVQSTAIGAASKRLTWHGSLAVAAAS